MAQCLCARVDDRGSTWALSQDKYPLPRIDDLLIQNHVQGSVSELLCSYHWIWPVAIATIRLASCRRDAAIKAFSTPFEHYEFQVLAALSFGFTIAPVTFQPVMKEAVHRQLCCS